MKNQAFFCSKDKRKKLKCCLLQLLVGALRVKTFHVKEFQVVSPLVVYQHWKGR